MKSSRIVDIFYAISILFHVLLSDYFYLIAYFYKFFETPSNDSSFFIILFQGGDCPHLEINRVL